MDQQPLTDRIEQALRTTATFWKTTPLISQHGGDDGHRYETGCALCHGSAPDLADAATAVVKAQLAALDGENNGVGYLDAGPYDSDSVFLTTYCENADLGRPKTLDSPEQHPDWDRAIDHALGLLGIPNSSVDAPAWLLIADVS